MAFDDILAAIIAHTDEKISAARKEQQGKLTAIRQKNEDDLEILHKSIIEQKEAKKASMLAKADARGESIIKNTELQTKQELLEKFYEAVVAKLGTLDDKTLTPLFTSMLKKLPADGVIQPAKHHEKLLKSIAKDYTFGESISASGGFIFTSATQEQDFTFETLLKHTVRPSTEVLIANRLFS